MGVEHPNGRGCLALDVELGPFAMPAFNGLETRYPGLGQPHIGLYGVRYKRMAAQSIPFPTANASIAQALVRPLIPQAVHGEGVEDIVATPTQSTMQSLESGPDRPYPASASAASRIIHRSKRSGGSDMRAGRCPDIVY